MAGMCYGLNMTEAPETTVPAEPTAKRRIEIHPFNFTPTDSAVAPPPDEGGKMKRLKNEGMHERAHELTAGKDAAETKAAVSTYPKFGVTSVCGRRRDMEDKVSVHPNLCGGGVHFFGVFDGHGCSHVASRCKDKMHEIVKDEAAENGELLWEHVMCRSFYKMDKDVSEWCGGKNGCPSSCRCELRSPQCDAVGSTAVVAVVSPDKIVVSNCGDSRAVLCRSGVAVPLSVDHKPDRPDELNRIQGAGGRVIFWDGPRVLGVLSMSRAIGDIYLKPYVTSEPEVTVTERRDEDECLILASDGLWDVVSNETACGVARMCLQSRKPHPSPLRDGAEHACSDASVLLTKLALARHTTDNVTVVVVDLRNCIN